MASAGGLGRFARGKPHGNDAVPETASGGSTFEDPESAWMTFHDESASDFGFNEYNFQDDSAQGFDLGEQSSRHDMPLAGLRLFKSPPTNTRSEGNQESHDESMEAKLDTTQAVPCVKSQTAFTLSMNGDSTHSKDNGMSGSSVVFAPCPEPFETSKQKASDIDDSMAIETHDSIDSSACIPLGLVGGKKTVERSLLPALAESSSQGAKPSALSQETNNSSRRSSDSTTNLRPSFDTKHLFLTANESTRVIPVPRSVEKCAPGIPVESFKKPETSHTFTPPGTIARKPLASHGVSEQAAQYTPIAQVPEWAQRMPGSHKIHSTPAECHGRSERPITSPIPVVTPGEVSAHHDSQTRMDNFMPDGSRDKHSVSVLQIDKVRKESTNLDSQNGTPLDQGFDFEELHAKFLTDIRDLEDLQEGNTTRLLFMQGIFATSYAESLKDQASLLDLLGNLEKVTATAQEMISRFEARTE